MFTCSLFCSCYLLLFTCYLLLFTLFVVVVYMFIICNCYYAPNFSVVSSQYMQLVHTLIFFFAKPHKFYPTKISWIKKLHIKSCCMIFVPWVWREKKLWSVIGPLSSAITEVNGWMDRSPWSCAILKWPPEIIMAWVCILWSEWCFQPTDY